MHSEWHLKRKLLCVRLDSASDVLMTTPALNALDEAVPGRHLTLLTSQTGARAARLVPALDEVIEFEAPWMKPPRANVADDRALINRLAARRHERYRRAPLAGERIDTAVVARRRTVPPVPARLLPGRSRLCARRRERGGARSGGRAARVGVERSELAMRRLRLPTRKAS